MVTFSNEVNCENGICLPHIHRASETVGESFSKLGYAHCVFQDCCKVMYLAVYQILANMNYPESYESLFLYYAGHRQSDHISTRDSYIAINSLKNLLSIENLKDISKVLIFDCCQMKTGVLSQGSTQLSVDNLMVIHMTSFEGSEFFIDDRGLSVATTELVKLLKQKRSYSFVEFFTWLNIEVKKAAKMVHPDIQVSVDLNGSLNKSIDLYKGKRKASKLWVDAQKKIFFVQYVIWSMTFCAGQYNVGWIILCILLTWIYLYIMFCVTVRPYNVKIAEDNDLCVLSWRRPLHGTHQHLQSYCLVTKVWRSEGYISGWTIAQEGKFLQL